MLADIRCRSPSGINYSIIIFSCINICTFLATVQYGKVFTTTKRTDIVLLLSASGWSYSSTEHRVCNPNWPCCQVLKWGGSSLCSVMFSGGFPGPYDLLILSGNRLNLRAIPWASWIKTQALTTVLICPEQFFETATGTYPKGSRGRDVWPVLGWPSS